MNELIKPGDFIIFNKDIFTTDYFDQENDSPNEVMILSNTQYGVLTFKNKIIKEGFIFKISEVENLKYTRINKSAYTEDINFKVSDLNPNKKFSNMAVFTINVNAYVNQPPDQIGDNNITIENREVYIFTVDDLTTNTTPPYDDPEGDGPYKLKITKLPSNPAKLQLNGIDVVSNQEILFTDIADGLFTAVSPDINESTDFNFTFTISDLGSQQYYEE